MLDRLLYRLVCWAHPDRALAAGLIAAGLMFVPTFLAVVVVLIIRSHAGWRAVDGTAGVIFSCGCGLLAVFWLMRVERGLDDAAQRFVKERDR